MQLRYVLDRVEFDLLFFRAVRQDTIDLYLISVYRTEMNTLNEGRLGHQILAKLITIKRKCSTCKCWRKSTEIIIFEPSNPYALQFM